MHQDTCVHEKCQSEKYERTLPDLSVPQIRSPASLQGAVQQVNRYH